MNICTQAGLCAALMGAALLGQEPIGKVTVQMQGGRAEARVSVVGSEGGAGASSLTHLKPGKLLQVESGKLQVHFPHGSAGKPASLGFAVGDGARVDIAAAVAPPMSDAASAKVLFEGDGAFAGTLDSAGTEVQVRTAAASQGSAHDYLLSVSLAVPSSAEGAVGAAGRFGIVARHHPKRGCYVLSLDWRQSSLRLERWMGGDHVLLREVALAPLSGRHSLAFQVQGFRLQGFLDDRPLIQSFDGALATGGPGVAWAGPRPTFGELAKTSPAPTLASAAIEQVGQVARIHAQVQVVPGHLHVLELALDQPHCFVPRTPGGFELFVGQPLTAPFVLWADFRNSLSNHGIGEVPPDGRLSVEVSCPDLLALRMHSALARILLVSPDGSQIVAMTPAVRIAL